MVRRPRSLRWEREPGPPPRRRTTVVECSGHVGEDGRPRRSWTSRHGSQFRRDNFTEFVEDSTDRGLTLPCLVRRPCYVPVGPYVHRRPCWGAGSRGSLPAGLRTHSPGPGGRVRSGRVGRASNERWDRETDGTRSTDRTLRLETDVGLLRDCVQFYL